MNYWDKQFCESTNLYGMQPSLSARCISLVRKKFDINTVLDIGFGYGRDVLYLGRKSFQVFGIDSSFVACEITQKRLQQSDIKAVLRNETIVNTTLKKETFDAINCFHFFHLLMGNERVQAVKVIYDLLKSGGIIILNVYSVKNSEFGIGNEVEKSTYDFGEVKGRPVHFFDVEELKELFNDFNILKIRDFKLFENHGGRHYHDEIFMVAQKL